MPAVAAVLAGWPLPLAAGLFPAPEASLESEFESSATWLGPEPDERVWTALFAGIELPSVTALVLIPTRVEPPVYWALAALVGFELIAAILGLHFPVLVTFHDFVHDLRALRRLLPMGSY